ncbi:MAG TPA: WecB/TagA/CpsF family glycosyltransferase [bacterium]
MAAHSDLPSTWLLGVRIHLVTLGQAVDRVLELIHSGGVHQVVTLNGAMLARASGDPGLRETVNSASLATADGAGVLLAGRILGVRFPERVPGVDLVAHLFARGADRPLRVFLLGARPGVAAAAGAALAKQHRSIAVVGADHGYFAAGAEAAVADRIRRASPDVLLVAMGFPKQEEWIAAHRDSLGVPVAIGVGGTFDVLAGLSRRAPRWMQRAGLEWVYRLVQEPHRWRTAATIPLVVWLAVKERIAGRAGAAR